MTIFWPLVRRASLNILEQRIRELKLHITIIDVDRKQEKERADDKRDRLIEAREMHNYLERENKRLKQTLLEFSESTNKKIDELDREIEVLKEERDNWRKEASK